MKKNVTRVLSLLLILVLLAGFLPVRVVAGGSVSPIMEARVFVHFPIGGQAPNMESVVVGSTDFTVDYVHFFNCYNGEPVGSFLQNMTYVAGRLYACQVHLVPKDAEHAFTASSAVYLNGRSPEDIQLSDDGSAYCTVFFRAALGTCTVTFDTCGFGPAHDPIKVPTGGVIADAVADVSELTPPDQDYAAFVMWAEDPLCEPYSYNAFSYTGDTVTESMTLYAHWSRCVDSVDLYLELPANCLTEDVGKAQIRVPSRANYSVETENFYFGLTYDYGQGDLIYVGPFQKGWTLYSWVTVYTPVARDLPQVNLYGANLIKTVKINEYSFVVYYSVKIPDGDSLTQASAYLETPKAGQSAASYKPSVVSLTPGLEMSVTGWFTEPTPSGTSYQGTLKAGKTYYALLTIGGYYCPYKISAGTLNLNLRGLNVGLAGSLRPCASGYDNHIEAMVKVTIPNTYDLVAEVPYGGGKVRTTRESNPKWVSTLDLNLEEGRTTLEAKADADHLFKSWYNADTYEMLSKSPAYTFNLNKNVRIRASFVRKTPFVDVGAWDYFYEPVLWAIEHDPVITTGKDKTHFNPYGVCTREQAVTFLWRANNCPNPTSNVNPFKDVNPGSYSYKAILWAVEQGITTGASSTTFNPYGICTREQIVTFLWRAQGKPMPTTANNPFSDVSKTSYSYNAILWAWEEGIAMGTSGTKFSPGNQCTRGMVVTFLYRCYGPKG